jgi:HSP20 family protein
MTGGRRRDVHPSTGACGLLHTSALQEDRAMKKNTDNERAAERGHGEKQDRRQPEAEQGAMRRSGVQPWTAGGGRESNLQRAGRGELSARGFGQGPFAFMRRLSDEMDRLFESFLGAPAASEWGDFGRRGAWWPQIDVEQQGDTFLVRADLPGVRKEDVTIQFENDTLIIEGERREEQERTDRGYRRTERSYGNFYRSVRMPPGADLERAQAQFRDGVLEISVPCEQRQVRTIPIQAGEQVNAPQTKHTATEQDREHDTAV